MNTKQKSIALLAAILFVAYPPAPTQLAATLVDGGHVLLTWVNNYVPPKKKGTGGLTVQRGINISLAGDPFWGAQYSYVAWTPVARLPLTTAAYVDTLPPGVDLAAIRYRVLVRSHDGVTVSSAVVEISP